LIPFAPECIRRSFKVMLCPQGLNCLDLRQAESKRIDTWLPGKDALGWFMTGCHDGSDDFAGLPGDGLLISYPAPG